MRRTPPTLELNIVLNVLEQAFERLLTEGIALQGSLPSFHLRCPLLFPENKINKKRNKLLKLWVASHEALRLTSHGSTVHYPLLWRVFPFPNFVACYFLTQELMKMISMDHFFLQLTSHILLDFLSLLRTFDSSLSCFHPRGYA